ncbi:hypothetical protein [Leptolyngbya sp. FACHB-671]|uniref:hypothetical protein n=1 Tax=Leptolyngbya sp. FACHB-671 TaxID=2692812 RepID=UPI001F54B175|nr:hypothetical protein [Leptolyngbya sp. FACHB-671]
MNHQYQMYVKRFLVVIGAGLLTMPLLFYGRLHFQRPPRTDQEKTLFQGIVYRRIAESSPRPIVMHIITIDLTVPGVGVFVTPGMPTPDNRETNAQTTSEFVDEFGLQLAVNANFFILLRRKHPGIIILTVAIALMF